METQNREWMPENRDKQKYSKETQRIFASFGETKPTLLLHACCAPCSSYTLEYLTPHFSRITLFFYNPNITPAEEYIKRLEELERLVKTVSYSCAVDVLPGEYDPQLFFAMAKGMESLPEGGERCYRCYSQRLRETAKAAAAMQYDWFATTLSISPHKNVHWLNYIGLALEGEMGVPYLVTDLKKNGGYARSIALSKEYDLYRQNWCGCVFSKKVAEVQSVLLSEYE